jgi:MFS family permease
VAVGADVARLRAVAPEYVATMAGYQRRNLTLLILDGATFAFAISLLSETTIVPAFVQGLSNSAVLVGLVGALYALGHYLPQLIGAHLVQGRPRRKPVVLAIVIAERVGILAIALVAQMTGAFPVELVLPLFFLAGLKEEPYPLVEERRPLRHTLVQIPGILRTNLPYRRFLVARAFLALATMGIGFVVVDGIDGSLQPSDAALLAAVFILSQALLGFALSLLGSYAGWKTVVVLGAVLLMAGMGGAFVAEGLFSYVLVFVALGGANAVTIIGDPNMSIELAPTEATSVYLGTTSTLLAPFFIAGPLLAGWIAPLIGYTGVFVIAAVCATVGLALSLRITEPRRMIPAETGAVGQPGVAP